MSTAKKVIKEMLPVKKYLDLSEATAYTNTGKDIFLKDVAPYVSVGLLGKKRMYKHTDIDALIEKNLLTNHKN